MSAHSEGTGRPPIETEGLRLRPPSRAAAGLKAIGKTVEIASREMGLLRGAKALLKVNQVTGFDCQSCAWPNPDDRRSAFEFCENGAKAVADEATTKRITAEFFAEHSVASLQTRSDHWLGQQGRLTTPMILRPGATHYAPVSWDEAFALIADHLHGLENADEATFYTSGRTSNEAAFLYQLFVRAFGTNNLPDCSNLCHESSGAALTSTIGIGKGTVTLADFDQADTIFILGQNPGTNHPRMLTALQSAKRRGCTIVSLNPLPEVGTERFVNPQDLLHPLRAPGVLLGAATELVDLWLPVRINGDQAALQGILKELLRAEDAAPGTVVDRVFVDRYTTGFEAWSATLRAADWATIEQQSGLSRAQLGAAAEIARRSKALIACWAMGLTQHKNAVATIQEVVNFLLLRGNFGRPGAGACPVRGHSNVQGDRTMGICDRPSEAFLAALEKEFGFSPPRRHGADVVRSIRAMHGGHVRVFFALGGNFVSASPDSDFTASALRRCQLTAHVSTKLNRSHLITGQVALILPCLGRSERDLQASGEQFVTVEDSMGIVSASRGAFPPASEQLLSEVAIVARLATATLGGRIAVDWRSLAANYDSIRNHIERVIPGFENYNHRIRNGPFYLPNPVRDTRTFPTAEGKAVFSVSSLAPPSPPKAGDYVMMTIRTHDQFNTTVYGLDDRYRGVFNGRRVIFMNEEDMREAGLVQGQLVDLTSHHEGQTRHAPRFMVAPYRIPRRCTATYFPEANALVPIDSVADVSNTPTSKSVRITVTPVANAEAAAATLRAEAREAEEPRNERNH